ncbi:MAG: ABC transporter permease [Candidatus Melainabacteria bacterium]|nr:ABC transporter permease [Candidatus Melainabacteria bacterium]
MFTQAGVASIFKKELIQLLRDRYLVGFIIALPIAQLLVTGLAIQRDMKHIPTLVLNRDKHYASYELLKAFEQSSYFDIKTLASVQTDESLIRTVKTGQYRLGLIIPPDYSKNLLSGQSTSQVNLVLDGTNANISKSILDAAQAILSNHALEVARQNSLQGGLGAAGRGRPIILQTKVINNPDLSPSIFLIPGILGVIMHLMTVLFTSSSIVRERETGTLEQLMVTPLLVTDLMLGKILPYALIGLLDMVLTLGVMVGFFSIPISGGFGFLCIASTVFILTSLGLGLLISTCSRTQVQSVQMTMGLLLPSLLLSGFVFPLEPMPWFIKVISYLLPLTYYLEIIRGVVIKGSGFMELWQPFGLLALSTIVLMTLSILRFRKQVA